MQTGVCKLTGISGHFVRCHLIPKSLTRLPTKGRHRIEAGNGIRPFGRFDSWFDERLVVTKGEQILGLLDDWAVKTLRANRLIWSGWVASGELAIDRTPDGTPFRKVNGIDGDRLRLFLLSLLWRAASTSRTEFNEIQLSPSDIEILRESVCDGVVPPADFYPITLIQFSTRGDPHNQTPIKRTIDPNPNIGVIDRGVDIFRFYFDGLLVYFYRPGPHTPSAQQLGPIAVGFGDDLFVTALPFETSWHWANLKKVVFESELVWPGVARTIGGNTNR